MAKENGAVISRQPQHVIRFSWRRVRLMAIVAILGLFVAGLAAATPAQADASIQNRATGVSLLAQDDQGLPLVDVSPELPYYSSTDYATATVQVQYGTKASMQIGWTMGPVATAGATGPAIVEMSAKINGRSVNWSYGPKTERADYVFHSAIASFQYGGDAYWTHHRLKAGDTVELHIYSAIPQANGARWFVRLDAVFQLD